MPVGWAGMSAQCEGAKVDCLLVFEAGVPGTTPTVLDIPVPYRAATSGMVFAPVFLATAEPHPTNEKEH
jgi:hypothetical protein